jgi:RNA methyltransferase, TrmH family
MCGGGGLAMDLTKARIKAIKGLGRKKHRHEAGRFIVEGMRLVEEAADSDFDIIEVLYTSELLSHSSADGLMAKLHTRTDRVLQVSRHDLEAVADTVTAQGILAVLRQKEWPVDTLLDTDGSGSVIVAMDSISDPGNAGTIIRTCDYFGVSGILLGRNAVELYNPKVVRATMGGLFHMPIADDVDLPSALTYARTLGYRVYVTDLQGETHFDKINYDQKSLIVFGNEAWGVSDQLKDLADMRVMIRRYGSAESLNVSVACGVILSRIHKLFE